MRTIAVIQARMGSTRLPGKILGPIEGRPLLGWTIAAVRAVPGVDDVVVATSDRPEDDAVAEAMRGLAVRVHRGSIHDVLRRVADAVRPFEPDVVLRQTGDNPFVDPEIMSAQLVRLEEGPFDYVGIAGLHRIIEPEVRHLGYELVRVCMIGGRSDPTLQVMAERPDTRQPMAGQLAGGLIGVRGHVEVGGDLGRDLVGERILDGRIVDQWLHGGHVTAGARDLVSGPDGQHRERIQQAANHDENARDRSPPADVRPAAWPGPLGVRRAEPGAFEFGALVLAGAGACPGRSRPRRRAIRVRHP